MKLDKSQREQLKRVLNYLYEDEEKDCEFEGFSIGNCDYGHIFQDVKALSDALNTFEDNDYWEGWAELLESKDRAPHCCSICGTITEGPEHPCANPCKPQVMKVLVTKDALRNAIASGLEGITMPCIILYCSCSNKEQDTIHGPGRRVFNKTKTLNEWRCTVCKAVKVEKPKGE